MSISVQSLTKQYGTQTAVNAISFEAAPGTIMGFLGPNGAGKSTTMKIATCYLPPTSGTVSVCGYDVNHSPLDVRANVGYLPEHNPLYLDMYVHEYLHFSAKTYGIKGQQAYKRIAEVIELVGINHEQKKKIGALSKGYRQRVGLAQALVHDPQVLILDEPTTGLDPNQIVEIRNVIKEVSHHKTVLLSTHIMQEVQALCDKVVIIHKGNIVANSNLADLKSSENQLVIGVEFEKTTDDMGWLERLEGVSSLTVLAERQYKIQATIDLRAEIFRQAVARGITLVGLSKEEISLESIFKELTKNN